MNTALTPSRVRELLPAPVALVGFGLEGQSTYRFLRELGYARSEIIVLDQGSPAVEDGVRLVTGSEYLSGLIDARSAVRSAGVRPSLLAGFSGSCTSQVELFFELYRGPSVGITGTFGKGTTLGMLDHVLTMSQKPHRLGGNYGVPVLDLLLECDPGEIPLLELSSFQLMTLGRSPKYAAVLATTTEHLDWHVDVDEYRAAKANMVRFQNASDLCVYAACSEGAAGIALQSPSRKIAAGLAEGDYSVHDGVLRFCGQSISLSECSVRGEHMLHNMAVAAALAVALGVDPVKVASTLRTFPGLPLRLEYSGRSGDVVYYNDSYATRPEAALAAARSFSEPLALILGGSEKFVDFSELCAGLASHPSLRRIALIGQTAGRLRDGLRLAKCKAELVDCETLEQALVACEESLKGRGVVLLSPACASFGMFQNYKHRGQEFHRLVSEHGAMR